MVSLLECNIIRSLGTSVVEWDFYYSQYIYKETDKDVKKPAHIMKLTTMEAGICLLVYKTPTTH